MVRNDGLIVCDNKTYQDQDGEWQGIVVNDGKTILPGYIKVVGGKVYEVTSSDPQNSVEHLTETQIGKIKTKKGVKLEFCGKDCFKDYLGDAVMTGGANG